MVLHPEAHELLINALLSLFAEFEFQLPSQRISFAVIKSRTKKNVLNESTKLIINATVTVW